TGPALHDAVHALVAGGAQRIGFLSGPSQTTTGVERLAEFTDAAAAAGVETVIQHGDFQEEAGRRGMQALLAADVDAVLTADSRMTLGAVRECLDNGIVPAGDLPFIGFDDIAPFALLQPPLPLICQDLEGMATTAAQLLNAPLDAAAPRRHVHARRTPAARPAARRGPAHRAPPARAPAPEPPDHHHGSRGAPP